MSVQGFLERIWYGRSPWGALLLPLAWLFGAVVALRRELFQLGILRTHRIDCPVVVVGNLTVGGTGKTPFVAWLASELSQRGLRVGIVSRGYGRRGGAVARWVEPGDDWRETGDEPLLLRRSTGCLTVVAKDRLEGARMLKERGVAAIVADDGLQHLRLGRECEFVVVDGERGFGNGRLLPAGPLRESIWRLETVDGLVVNGWPRGMGTGMGMGMGVVGNAPPRLFAHMVLVSSRAVSVRDPTTTRPIESFRGGRVHAVAGIGNPTRFFGDLRRQGVEVIEHPFPDHHPYVASELEFADDLPVLMTEKDAVKCAGFGNPRLWFVPVAAQLAPEAGQALVEGVLGKIAVKTKG